MAISLGFNVATATITNPTFQTNGSEFDYLNNVWEGDNKANLKLQWKQDGNGLITLHREGIGTAVSTIEIKFDKTKEQHSTLWGNSTATLFPNTNVSNPTSVFDSQGNGIKLADDKNKKLRIQFGLDDKQPKNAHLDLFIRNHSGDVALDGNLEIAGGYSNWDPAPDTPNLTATFYGDLKGNVTQNWEAGGWTPYSDLIFEKGSITGNVTSNIGGINLKFAEGGVKGNVTIATQNNGFVNIKLIRTTGADLSIGKKGGFIEGQLSTSGDGRVNFLLGYDDSVVSGGKTISLDPEDKTKFSVARGSFTFYNMKALNFVDDSGAQKTFTLESGTIDDATFQFDRSILNASKTVSIRGGSTDTLPVIIKGNISAQDGKSIRLSLVDDTNITTAPNQNALKTLKVEGKITVTGGGLSLFYNDRLDCFEAKVQATGGIEQTGGYIGRNDAFFDAGTFTADNKKQDLTTIQAINGGISHLRFNDNVIVSKGVGASGGHGSQLFFYQGVNIRAFDSLTKIDPDSVDSAIYTKNASTSNIYIGGSSTSTITGNITTKDGGQNIITATGTLSVNGNISADSNTANSNRNVITTSNLTLSGNIVSGANNGGWLSQNLITINGTTTFSGSSREIIANQLSNTNTEKYNIIKFAGSVSGNISKLTAKSNGWNDSKTKNVLSFDGSQALTFTIGAINDSTDFSDKYTGYNYIGAGLTTGEGASLALKSGFSDTTWSSDDYKARNLTLNVTNGVYAKGGRNYINVGTLSTNTLNATNSGRNYARASAITVSNLTVSAGGINNIIADTITVNGSINGSSTGSNDNANNIVANNLIFSASATGITAGISSSGWGVKNRFDISGATTLSGSNFVIKADSTGDAGGSKYNILKFGTTLTNSATISNLLAISRKNESDNLGNTKNILSFEQLSADTTLTIGNINGTTSAAPANGTNYIGKNLTSGSGSSLDFNTNFTDANWDIVDYMANHLSLNITGNVYAKAGKNYISVSSISVNGDITSEDGGVNNIALAQGVLNGNISGTTNITLLSNNATLALNGINTGDTTHTITSLKVLGTSTLTLDNSGVTSGSIQTTVDSVTNGENLAVVMNGKNIPIVPSGSREEVALILTNTNGTTLKSIALADGSDGGHRVAFKAGADNKVLEAINIGKSQSFALELYGNGTSLDLAGLSGASDINIEEAGTKILSGGSIDTQNLTLKDQSELILKNTNTTIALLTATSGTKLILGGSDKNSTNATVSKLDGGNNLSIKLNGQGEGKGANLSILDDNDSTQNNKAITLNGVSVAGSSTNNTLDISSLSTVGIDSAVSLAGGTGLTLKLKDTALTVTGGIDSRITDEAKGALTIRVDSGVGSTSTATSSLATSQASEVLNITSLDMVGDGTTKVTFKSNANIGTLTAQACAGNELTIGDSGDTTVIVDTTISTLSQVTLAGNTATLQLNKGASLTINTLNSSATTNNLVLNGSTLSLGGKTNTISNLTTSGNAVINLAVGHNGSNVVSQAGQSRTDAPVRNKLAITTLSGNLSANVFVSKSQADQIQIDNTTKGNTLTLYARGNASEIVSITRNDNILVADTSGGTAKGNLAVKGGISDLGGLVVQLNVEEDTATKGKWYVGKTEVKGVDKSFQEVTSTALAVNYDLYLANFNSLNKRMGELRDNPYSQGVWARVFGGAMSNDFGAGSKTQYVAAQAGYDYALSVGENAKNYVGVALAYGSSWTKANDGVGLSNATLDNINSNMVEAGIYNSYVMDSGWYNDTILKFDYIMSDFDISASGNASSHSTNNFAMILSDEFGYRYKFAENEKGNWYIDPQVEVAFGYFNQSDFNQAIANNFTTVEASQDAILTLRARAGASLGKKFITEKGFASLYVGAFYEYDYINGGKAQTQVLSISNSLDQLESNGRAIVNVGSNIELTDGVRMYIDVEKSFGDKQRTFMQFNLGARYSF